MYEPDAAESDAALSLTLGHLYPDQLNIYGDRGNIIVLRQRCRWRGVDLRVVPLDLGEPLDALAFDLLFIGGGQDKEQSEVARDLRERKGEALRAAVEGDMPVLAVCGGYQLLARFYRPAEGPDLEGAGIFDAWTIHKGKDVARCVGNVALEWGAQTLVGFENHGGRTYLGAGARPLGRVLAGHGNNDEDGFEGCVYRNTFGTYLHGSLLPKNPHFADHLLGAALARKYGPSAASLAPLDDAAEWRAHDAMLRRLSVAQRTPSPPASSSPTPGNAGGVTSAAARRT
jgi:lipid II isoglutaminyl synthase (glutamine-hydrolysing)